MADLRDFERLIRSMSVHDRGVTASRSATSAAPWVRSLGAVVVGVLAIALFVVAAGSLRSGAKMGAPGDSDAVVVTRVSPGMSETPVALPPLSRTGGNQISVSDVRSGLVEQKSGGEAIGLKIVDPATSLRQAGFRDGDTLTYIDDQPMTEGQSPEVIQQMLRPGAQIFVGRDGREISFYLP